MSDSEIREIEAAGQSTAAEPHLALREALTGLAANLAAAGGAPPHMISMSWSTPDPAAFDPSLHDLDLCYRETFGGFRPPIALVRLSSGPFVVRARAQIPQSSSAEP